MFCANQNPTTDDRDVKSVRRVVDVHALDILYLYDLTYKGKWNIR